ncbi:MAG: histidine kinase [Bacteroidia bacterium]|nr:histidine kinase [Bacteroidia bacterium]
MRHVLITGFLLLLAGLAPAQQPVANLQVFTDRQGLSDKRIYSIAQDKTGFIWIGTANGLNRYDGYTFRQFFPVKGDSTSLPGAVINRLAPDRRGNLWIATNNGMCRHNPYTYQFTRYPTRLPGSDPRDASILDFFPAPDGKLWLITRAQNLLVLDPVTRRVQRVPVPDPAPEDLTRSQLVRTQADDIFDVWGSGDSVIWLGGRSGVYRTNLKFSRFEHIPIPSVFPKGVQYVRQTGPESLWIMVWQQGFYRYDLAAGSISEVPSESGAPYSNLWIGNGGQILLGSGTGLTWLDPGSGRRSQTVWRPDATSALSVTAMYQDRSGILWTGTENGLVKYDPYLQGFQFTRIYGHGASLYANDLNDVWHSAADGRWYAVSAVHHRIYVLDAQGRVQRSISTLPYARPSVLFEASDGSVWLGTGETLLRFDPGSGALRPAAVIRDADTETYTVQLAEDRHGRIWWATSREGLFCHDPRSGLTERLGPRHGFEPLRLVHLLADRSRRYLWVTTDSEGFWELDQETGQWTRYQDDFCEGLSTSHSLAQDLKGDVWISSMEGLLCYSPGSRQCEVRLNRDKGLPMNLLTGGLCDQSGILWWGIGDRILRVDPLSSKFKLFDDRYGASHTPFGYSQLTQSRLSGELHACASGGFVRWHPDSIRINTALPSVVNTRLLVNNIEVLAPGDSVPAVGLGENERTFALEFAALSYTLPEEAQYQWKLEGSGEGWSNPSTDRFVRLSFVPPGDYTLLVKAANHDGVWNEHPLRMHVHVEAAWWQTWPARIAFVLLAGGLLALLIRYREAVRRRVARMQEHARELEKQQLINEVALLKTQVNPHFLFNSLSILSSLVRTDPELSEQFIDQLARSYRYILEQKEQTLVSLRTELEFIQSYAFLLKIRFERKFDLRFHLPEALLDRYKIAPLTLQLLIENAVKHNRMSAREPLIVEVAAEDEWLIVRNRLQPRSTPAASTGIGLQNIKDRYALLSDLPVQAGETEGTFTVKIPLIT